MNRASLSNATDADKIGKCDSCYWCHMTDNEIVCRYNNSNRNIVGATISKYASLAMRENCLTSTTSSKSASIA